MVDKEMAATSAAIEDAVRRIEVRDGWGAGAPPVPWGLGGLSAGCTHLSPRPRLCRSGWEGALGPCPELIPPLPGSVAAPRGQPCVPSLPPACSRFCHWYRT